MHPVLAGRRGSAAYPVISILLGLLLASALRRAAGLTWAAALAIAMPLVVVYASVCLASWYLCRAVPLRTSGLPRLLVTYLGAAALTSMSWVLAGAGWAGLLDRRPAFAGLAEAYGRQTTTLFVTGILIFLLAVAVNYVLIAFEHSREAETRALNLKVLAREAELKALRAQIDPHFLFNCLHSINTLTASDAAGARRMCVLLGDFFRTSLSVGAKDWISLAEELSLADQYLAIEKVRFGARLELDRRIEPESRTCLVPPLLLQPLLENAVRHGVSSLLEGGAVCLEAAVRRGALEISVANPCDPDRQRRRGTGVGLENVRMRLATLFGNEARLEVREDRDRFEVAVTLPAREAAEAVPRQRIPINA